MDTVLLQQIRKRAETTSLHQIISPKSMHEPISSRKDYANNYKKQSGNARKIIFLKEIQLFLQNAKI
jgi:hypothetical protein